MNTYIHFHPTHQNIGCPLYYKNFFNAFTIIIITSLEIATYTLRKILFSKLVSTHTNCSSLIKVFL
ncbi:hypothetical protein DR193_06920 [Lawsonia intracellularis]|nr:hypothetical protein DR193_06920 [Lawsonia intracellularis]